LYKQAKNIKENSEIHLFSSEKDMLYGFLSFWKQVYPDIISGWNSEYFDAPYLVARISEVLGSKAASMLSPFGFVRQYTTTVMEKEVPVVDIVGVAQLDYLALYKKFTYTNRESYKLDHIAYVELGMRKLDHSEYPTFKDFYTHGWDEKFVKYNQIDAHLIHELENKLKLIDLALMLAYTAKINYDEVFSPVNTWDALIHNYLWEKSICIPNKPHSMKTEYEGAYVKEPKKGKHKYVASFDATSLYPSIMQAWNMSPERLLRVDRRYAAPIDAHLRGEVEIPEDKSVSVAVNGAVFDNSEVGVMGSIIDYFMQLRKTTKNLMLTKKKEREAFPEASEEYANISNEISYLDVKQLAVKILLNSLYGACANAHFRYYDIHIAEAITLNGQYIIRRCGEEIDKKLCKKFDVEQCNIYSDTDSLYITFGESIDKNFPKATIEKKIDIMDKLCEDIVRPVINNACTDLQNKYGCFRHTIVFKREALGDIGIWAGKKKYVLNVYDNEGVRYKEPHVKIMGLEMIKSSTPEVVRNKLTESLAIILHGEEDQLKSLVDSFKIEFENFSPEQIAFPRGVNNLDAYMGANNKIYIKGTPLHVKAALIHNSLVNKLKLTKKYQLIRSGDKIKYLYLLPNKMREESIGFIGELPVEFGLHKYVDYGVMFEKTFLDPLNGLIKNIGWSVHAHASLSDFFG
jgi:DNA polymerase elongation subunit (family B)